MSSRVLHISGVECGVSLIVSTHPCSFCMPSQFHIVD